MKKPKQLQLPLSELKSYSRVFGGSDLHGKRRSRRPLSTKEPIHLVMRSSWANGSSSFLQSWNKREIERLLKVIAKKYCVRVYQSAIVGNHLHLIIKIDNRNSYKTFIRVLSSQIASHVMKRQSFKVFKQFVLSKQEWGDPQQNHQPGTEVQGLEQQFWQFRPWTRILYWGRDFRNCCKYAVQNTLEALGFIPYTPRSNRQSKPQDKARRKSVRPPD